MLPPCMNPVGADPFFRSALTINEINFSHPFFGKGYFTAYIYFLEPLCIFQHGFYFSLFSFIPLDIITGY